jgi:hypothetical protein
MGPAARVEAQPFFQLDNGESENADGDDVEPAKLLPARGRCE